jgi:hypothetical protein
MLDYLTTLTTFLEMNKYRMEMQTATKARVRRRWCDLNMEIHEVLANAIEVAQGM